MSSTFQHQELCCPNHPHKDCSKRDASELQNLAVSIHEQAPVRVLLMVPISLTVTMMKAIATVMTMSYDYGVMNSSVKVRSQPETQCE